MLKPSCTHLTLQGVSCRCVAVVEHPTLGPLCSRHAGRIQRRESQHPDLTATLCARVTPSEKAAVTRDSDMLGLTVSEFVRRRTLQATLPPPPPRRAEAIVMREWTIWGRNLNAIARDLAILRQGGRTQSYQQILDDLSLTVEACWDELRECRANLIELLSHGGRT